MKNLIGLIFLSLMVSACAVYTPQTAPPVLIKEKGDLEISAGANTSSDLHPGLSAAVTYGFTDNVQTQVYASYISSGTSHFQLMTGYNFKLGEKNNFRLFGGYAYGAGEVNNADGSILSSLKPNYYIGSYQSYFGKAQLSRSLNKFDFGLSCLAGHFQPNYAVVYIENPNVTAYEVNQKGFLIEPSIFVNCNFNEKLGLSFTYSNARIKPLNQKSDYSSNEYKLPYNKYGNFGLSLKYLLKTERK